MSLTEIYSSYLRSQVEEKVRDPHRLYITDLGKCKRQVAYRLLETPKNPKLQQTEDNDTIMFGIADYLEATLADALDKEDRLVAYQYDIPMPDRENWGGRLDIIAVYDGCRIIEVKSVRSNKFNYADELPSLEHTYQAATYDHYVREEGYIALDAPPLLWYVDRGGSNSALEFAVDYNWSEIGHLMDQLDYMREALVAEGANPNALPDRLEKVLKLRSYGKKIVYEPSWRCGYCDYSDVCSPDLKKQEWANLDKETGIWTPTGRAQILQLRAFAESMTTGKVGDVF